MKITPFDVGAPASLTALVVALTRSLKPVVQQLNAISEGQVSAVTNASNAPPAANSTTAYAQGDFIRNNQPNIVGGKYILGWTCISAGKPGTWAPAVVTTS